MLTFAHGVPAITGRIRVLPEDFVVREWLGFDPDHDGDHALLTVRKREANTQWVARELAKRAGVHVHDVGFAGLKDRHALTEQSFSVPIGRNGNVASWAGFQGEGFEVLSAVRHRRKLRRGAHHGNDFEILVREPGPRHPALPTPEAPASGPTPPMGEASFTGSFLDARLTAIQRFGVPNYFGEQRFGREDSNLDAARRWFEQGQEPRDRHIRGFALSATRAEIFNRILSARVSDGTWNRLLDGDVANLQGTGSIFGVEQVDEVLRERCERMDIHPTGAMWGRGELRSQGAARQLEEAIAAELSSFAAGLAKAGLEQERRALRLAVQELQWAAAPDGLRLKFRLGRGAFATTVLREILNYQ